MHSNPLFNFKVPSRQNLTTNTTEISPNRVAFADKILSTKPPETNNRSFATIFGEM